MGSDRTLFGSLRTPSDPFWSQAWSLRALRLPDVWPSASGGPSTVVAVIDTGVDPAQPDLDGALVPGYDTLATGTGTADENGHGTAVAGIIAARSDNRVGVTSVCGSCSVMPVKVISASGFGDAAHIATGIVWAADHGARVINLSVVLDGPQQTVEDAVRYAHDRGVVVVAAAGNGGGIDPTYPAAYPEVISVAAVTGGRDALPVVAARPLGRRRRARLQPVDRPRERLHHLLRYVLCDRIRRRCRRARPVGGADRDERRRRARDHADGAAARRRRGGVRERRRVVVRGRVAGRGDARDQSLLVTPERARAPSAPPPTCSRRRASGRRSRGGT